MPVTPASTIALLLDFAKDIEAAAATALTTALPAAQILTRETDATVPKYTTPRIEIAFALTGHLPHTYTTGGKEYPDMPTGTLTFVCSVLRNQAAENLGALAGAVRAAMEKSAAVFNGTSLPWYQMLLVEETACTPATDLPNEEIAQAIVFELHFAIQSDAWPAED